MSVNDMRDKTPGYRFAHPGYGLIWHPQNFTDRFFCAVVPARRVQPTMFVIAGVDPAIHPFAKKDGPAGRARG